jgi:hypothetical protein
LRPIGIGRKNWLFAGADTGAETLARAMTIIETAKLNGLDPQAYSTASMITRSTGSTNCCRGIGHRWPLLKTVKPRKLRYQWRGYGKARTAPIQTTTTLQLCPVLAAQI